MARLWRRISRTGDKRKMTKEELDKSKVYTAVNADELKVGSKVIVADTLRDLKERVEDGYVQTLTDIRDDACTNRFEVDSRSIYSIAYLVSEPEKLKWTDLKVGDVIKHKGSGIEYMVIGLDKRNTDKHIRTCDKWFTDIYLERSWEKVEE